MHTALMIIGLIVLLIGAITIIKPFSFIKNRKIASVVALIGLLIWFASGFH